MQVTRLLFGLTALAALTAATAYGSPDGPYSRSATARCLASKHVQVHEGNDTSVPGNYPDLTFRYQGSELTIAFLPAQNTEGALGGLGQSIANAFAHINAALHKAGNVVFYRTSSNLTASDTTLITNCLR